jgi:hypothetical protein
VRGGKVPNYVDDVPDFEQFEEDTNPGYYYVDPETTFKEEDEIEAVLSHSRDEEYKDDPEDRWFENMVCLSSWMTVTLCLISYLTALRNQVEELLSSTQHRGNLRVPKTLQRSQAR